MSELNNNENNNNNILNSGIGINAKTKNSILDFFKNVKDPNEDDISKSESDVGDVSIF